MERQHITVPLDLPGVRVVAQRVTPTAIEVTVVRPEPGARCPGCGWWTTKQHDTRPRAKADEPLGERQVTVVVVRRRFRCPGCGRVFKLHDALCTACGAELDFPDVAIAPESARPPVRAG